MARKLRLEYPGAIYHVMNRGDRREAIFTDDADRQRFLDCLGEACAKTQWQVHAFCLLPNHFHLVLETPRANLVAGMKWVLGTYTSRFNRRHKFFGHLFSGRYKSLLVDGSGDGYLKTVCDYVHLNPARAKMLAQGHPLRDYRWSSYPRYLQTAARRPPWLRVDRLLGEHGIRKDDAAGRLEFEQRMEGRRHEPDETAWPVIRRGWCLGGKEFRQELLAELGERAGENHAGPELAESDEQKALSIVEEELRRRRWTREQLTGWRKGDKRKVRIALRLRRETTMTLKWMAEQLAMGTWANLARRLYEAKP